MRWVLAGALGISLVAHVGVAAVLVAPRAARSVEKPADPPPANAGETFELPAPDRAETPLANAAPSPDTNAASAPVEAPDAPARPTPPTRAKPAARPSHQGRPSAGHAAPGQADGAPGSTATAAMFGAVGDRSAADIAHAFTRGFAVAASGDASWASAALGAAGDATVTLTLDESGHITDMQVGGSPSAALQSGIRRTMSLIRGRPFIARGKVTKLRLVATVSADTAHDGLHGDVFAIGPGAGSFTGNEGSAFFAHGGRRVDLKVRLQ